MDALDRASTAKAKAMEEGRGGGLFLPRNQDKQRRNVSAGLEEQKGEIHQKKTRPDAIDIEREWIEAREGRRR